MKEFAGPPTRRTSRLSAAAALLAYVVKGLEGLDQAALRTVVQWTFEPARRAGQPVPTIARSPVTFRMY